MGKAEGEIGILLNEENGRSTLVQLPQDRKNLHYQLRSKPHRRLVEKEQPRLAHDRSCYGEHLLLAATQRTRKLVEALAEARKNSQDPLQITVSRDGISAHPSSEAKIFHHGKSPENSTTFRHMSHAEVHDAVGR